VLLSPFSVATKYYSPDGKGIYLRPASKVAPDGWGEPRMDNSTSPPTAVVPGTPGGPFPNAFIAPKEGVYTATATKYRQKAGCITWWGELLDPADATKGRHVLSYNGPKLRYFLEEGFSYGSDTAHNEVYYLGNYAAVAPGAVLGACIRTMDWTDTVTGVAAPEVFLIVACYVGGEERFFRKRWNYRVRPAYRYTDAVREAEMALYVETTNPYGWMLMGTLGRQGEAYPPETPWFFNQSGTEAVCLRRKSVTFDNGYDANTTEAAYDRYRLTLGESSVSFSNDGNSLPIEYEEVSTKTQPLHTSTDYAGHTHTWQEDHVSVNITCRGEQFVMADYIEDQLYYGKIKYDILRAQREYFTKGTDPTSYIVNYEGTDINISNEGLRQGPYYHNIYEYGYVDPAYVESEGNHEFTKWIAQAELIRLYFGPEGSEEDFYVSLHEFNSGTEDEWAGNPVDPNDLSLYFVTFYVRFPSAFFDIRQLAFFSHDIQTTNLFSSGTTAVDRTVQHKDLLYSEENPQGEGYRDVKITTQSSIDFGWSIEDMDSWPATFDYTLVRTTYDGRHPQDNVNGDVNKPGSKTYYAADATTDLGVNWPAISYLLYGYYNACKGNGVRTDRSEIAFSVEVPDVEQEGAYVVLSDIKPAGDPATLVGYGETFYPVGAC